MSDDYEEAHNVFCVQQPRLNDRDLSSANRYGKIQYLLENTDYPSTTPSACLHKINRLLKDFEPSDYILYAGGDPLGLGLVMSTLIQNGFTEFQLLKWDRDRTIQGERQKGVGFYSPLRVKLKL